MRQDRVSAISSPLPAAQGDVPGHAKSHTRFRIGHGTRPRVISRRIAARTLVFLGLMLFMAAATASMFVLLLQMRVSNEAAIGRVEHTQEVVVAIEDLVASAADVEVTHRAFLLTTDASYLPDFERETKAIWHQVFHLRELTADNPRQQANLLVLTDQLHDRLARMDQTLALAQDGHVADAVAVVRAGVGQQMMTAIRQTTDTMGAEERRLLARRRTLATQTDERTMLIEIALGIVMAAGFLLGLLVVARNLIADVTAEQLADTATERQRLLDMVDLAAVMLTDNDGIVLFWSEGCRRLYGWTVEQAVGRPARDLLQTIATPADAASTIALYREGTWSGELRQRRQDGTLLTVTVSRILQQAAKTRDRLVVETMADVTALRQAETQLLRSEAQFASLVDTAADGFVIASTQGSIQSVNRAGVALFGYDSASELIGRNLSVLMTPIEAARHDGYIAAHRDGAPPRLISNPGRELFAVRRDGTAFPVDLSVSSFGTDGDRCLTGIIRDATMRVQAEAALRNSEARLRLFIDTAPAAIAMFDREMRYLAVSRRFLVDFGLDDETPETMLGRSHYEAFPDLGEHLRVLHRRVLAGETVSLAEEPFRRANGTVVYLRREMVPWRPPDGGVGGLLLFTENMFERRQVEAALRETASRLRLVQRVGGIASSDRVLSEPLAQISEEFVELYGLPAGQTESSPAAWLAMLHPDDLVRVEAEVATALAGETILSIEFRIRRPDGATRWIAMRLQSFVDSDGRPHLISAHQDISVISASNEALEMRRQELEQRVGERTAALAAAEARFRGIFDAQFQFISLLSPDGTTLEMNRTALDAMLLSREQIIGRKLWDTDRWPRAAREQLRRDIATAASGILVRREVEIRGVEARPTWIDFSLKPVRDPLTNVVLWLIAESRDLTETRDLAAQLAQAQKVQALGQLAGGIAHDFNNILQAVSGAAALIERRPEDHDRTRRFARTALNAATRGLSITQRLLTFARRGELHSRPIATARLLHDMQDILSHTLGSTITVRVDVDDEVPALVADVAQLETALINLGTNARDAMSECGTLTLFAHVEHIGPDGVHPAGVGPGDYVRLDVADNGSGMDASILARVSEPFFTTKGQGKGTGLGLAMARGFAEQSGGGLGIRSAPGKGTTVTMWLRQADAATAGDGLAWTGDGERQDPVLPLPPGRSEGPCRRILLVDDDELVREVVAAQLEAEGFSTLVASSGPEALALLTAGEIVDAMISDFSMPGMNGATAIERARLLRPRLPCILLTGYAGATTTLPQGTDFTLVRKPASGPELSAQIDAMLEGARC